MNCLRHVSTNNKINNRDKIFYWKQTTIILNYFILKVHRMIRIWICKFLNDFFLIWRTDFFLLNTQSKIWICLFNLFTEPWLKIKFYGCFINKNWNCTKIKNFTKPLKVSEILVKKIIIEQSWQEIDSGHEFFFN